MRRTGFSRTKEAGGSEMIKRKVCFLIAAVLLFMASAVCEGVSLTWDQVCKLKTSRATTLYVLIDGELTQSSTLPAGTYIRTTGQKEGNLTGISYSANNIDPLYGFIDGSVIVSATTTVTLPSGKVVTVGEALVRSSAALNLYLRMEYLEDMGSSKTYTDAEGNVHEIGNESALEDLTKLNGDMAYYVGLGQAMMANGSYTRTVYRDDDGNETEVDVRYMGLARSMIVMNGEGQLVETWRLTWDTKAPDGQVLAIVSPPKGSGTVRLYAKSSKNSLLLFRVPSNRVVRVISTGKNWSLVDIDDDECPRGYIQTEFLDFFPNVPMKYESAQISVNGNTRGSDPVWIRSADNTNSGHITEFDLGTPLSVYADNGTWSEVDVGGYHAFILSKFVTKDSAVTASK